MHYFQTRWLVVALCFCFMAACAGESETSSGLSTDGAPSDMLVLFDGGSPFDATAVDVATPEDTPTQLICPGGDGCPCTEAGDCDSSMCIETSAGTKCGQPCIETCPEGFSCKH